MYHPSISLTPPNSVLPPQRQFNRAVYHPSITQDGATHQASCDAPIQSGGVPPVYFSCVRLAAKTERCANSIGRCTTRLSMYSAYAGGTLSPCQFNRAVYHPSIRRVRNDYDHDVRAPIQSGGVPPVYAVSRPRSERPHCRANSIGRCPTRLWASVRPQIQDCGGAPIQSGGVPPVYPSPA